jgi:molybdopterin converting factor small subunit
MVTVKFYNLLRSKYQVAEMNLLPGTLENLVSQILIKIPKMTQKELEGAMIFVNQKKISHQRRLLYEVNHGDIVIFTHFVGGG